MENWQEAALKHAKEEIPREACGLVIVYHGRKFYRRCKNISEIETQFIMDPNDLMAAEDEGCDILGIFHSHPRGPARPSQADLVGCENSKLCWYILGVEQGLWEEIKPSGYKAPLVGREFVHGVMDCYTIIKDWYKENKNADLPDFERKKEWWLKGDDLYMKHFNEAGFYPVEAGQIAKGDVILMQINSKVVNHGAVYLGRDVMIHHAAKRLSTREIYGGFYKKNTRLVVRFKGAAK